MNGKKSMKGKQVISCNWRVWYYCTVKA